MLFSVSHISNIAQQWNTETQLAHYLSATNDMLQQCITHLSPPDRSFLWGLVSDASYCFIYSFSFNEMTPINYFIFKDENKPVLLK